MHNVEQFRLFISSTFKDMDKERSYLVEWIFPRLKELCAERNVEFFPVDLRWGITEEEGKSGKILNVCMEEIDNSRPFFIGLLGDRYGWRPSLADLGESATTLLERYPWLAKDIEQELSITEMEMQYGALRNNESNAVFYIRKEQKEEKEKDIIDLIYEQFDEVLSPDYQHLTHLKETIENNPHVLSREFESPEDLGEKVFQDLKKVIEERFPLEQKEQWELLHEHSFRSHLKTFVPLDRYFQEIEVAFHKLTKEHKYLALHGIKGAGKSTVLCNFIKYYRQAHKETEILYYDIAKINLSQTVEWSWHLHRSLFESQVFSFFYYVDENLLATKASERIIVLDNLEYLPRKQHAKFIHLLTLFNFSYDVKVILTHTDFEYNPYHTSDEDMTYSNISIDKLHAELVEISGIAKDQIPLFVEHYMRQFGKSLSAKQLQQFQHPLYATNPYYLCMSLYQLVEFGSYEKLQNEIDYLTEIRDLEKGFYAEPSIQNNFYSISTPVTYTLDRVICRDAGDGEEQNMLSSIFWILFVSSRGEEGFTERELIEIFDFTPAQWAIFRPQVMLICRIQNGFIVFKDGMFDYILGHAKEGSREPAENAVIKYYEQIPWPHEYVQELKGKRTTVLTPTEQEQAEKSLRKAEVLPIFLFFSRKYDQLQAYFNNPQIRAYIPSDTVEWLEGRMRNGNIL